jgi:hypothetical protein
MTTITIHAPATVQVPRFAPIAAQLFLRLLDVCERTLTDFRQRKEESGRIAQANAVRRMADSVRDTDPRFASDLMAAADRHEIGR